MCTEKFINKPTGVSQTFGRDSTSWSISVCNSHYNSKIQMPYSISVLDEMHSWNYIYKNRRNITYEEKYIFKYKATNDTESCKKLIINGIKIKIEASKKASKFNLYVHETGYSYSMFRLTIPQEIFLYETYIMLHNEIFQQLPTDEDCTIEEASYDSCFNNFLRQKMNESAGCILKNAR